MKQFDNYPPFYQVQGLTDSKIRNSQLQHWAQHVRSFCLQKQVFLVDLNIVAQSSLFSSSDKQFQATKDLQLKIFNYMVQNNQGIWTDSNKQACWIYTSNTMINDIAQAITMKAQDDIMTIDEAQQCLQGSQYEKVPTQFFIIIIKELAKLQMLSIVLDGQKIEGIKIKQ
ncbi:ESCRT-II_complex subunit domain-containing protein [Hexamita inflata]|uniref:ESCRT-II complex subunit domain-containing protein n=1 Tax=Hexamita inflata TaxID=28002 RepID=A0AA86UXW1_9EUKA|nr:ESCRT-II complex subunit domain-containing protein [Hexamita inflata]